MTYGASREDWLSARKTGIGGSDAAAIMGLSQYASPYTVWADKTGRLPPKDDTEAMRLGRDLEDYIARRFAEKNGLRVRRVNRTIRNEKYPYSFAHIDRKIENSMAGLECKSVSPYRLKEFEDGMYPQEHYAQCLHYLAVTEYDAWMLAELILGTEFKDFLIERGKVQADMERVMEAEKEFWEAYVLPDVPPPADGLEATTKAINSVHRASAENSIDLAHMEDVFVGIAELKETVGASEREIERLKQEIRIAMGSNEKGECSAWVATWKPRKDGVRVFTIKEK